MASEKSTNINCTYWDFRSCSEPAMWVYDSNGTNFYRCAKHRHECRIFFISDMRFTEHTVEEWKLKYLLI